MPLLSSTTRARTVGAPGVAPPTARGRTRAAPPARVPPGLAPLRALVPAGVALLAVPAPAAVQDTVAVPADTVSVPADTLHPGDALSTATDTLRPAADAWLVRPLPEVAARALLGSADPGDAAPLEVEVVGPLVGPEPEGEAVRFRRGGEDWIVGDFYRAAGDWAARPSLIYLHGTGRAGRRGLWTRRPASLLAEAGYNVLAIDLLHWGDRATDRLTTFTETEQHVRLYNDTAAYREWVARTAADVRRSLDLLRDRYGLDESRTGLVGFSRGAAVAPIAAAADPRIAAVVMLYGGHADRGETGHAAAACNANYIGMIAPRPLLMVNGRADREIPAAGSVEPLYELALEPKRILWLDTGHQLPGREAWPAILAWLRQALP